ncbi:hypothetical protein EDC96DRAFT_607312 [Choanephora cucurbitarum]|nr:hypothetical protein EDC96DRAFT_566027 [Choanephora cucurbitarum]KAI8368334.1 hypothetical protein EDC96DRAFT_607312 [Choanephora cucurbitarum]
MNSNEKINSLLKAYFTSCISNDIEPIFENFIKTHSASLRDAIDLQDPKAFENCFIAFKRQAVKQGLKNVKKGHAAKAWGVFVVLKQCNSVKRKHVDTNLIEELDNFALPQQHGEDFIFKQYNISKAIARYANDSLNDLKSTTNEVKKFREDMNRWLAIHNIVKLNRQLDTELATVFNAGIMQDLCRHFRVEVFGKPARLTTSLKVEVLDLLADFDETRDTKALKRELNRLSEKENGAVFRTLESLVNLLNKMTKLMPEMGEKKVESILEAVWRSLFKVTDDHDPYGYDNVLFPAPHPLSKCRPDFVVEVRLDGSFINLTGEIKPYPCSSSKLALDAYRLGVFSLSLLEKYGLSNVMAFQAKGLEVTFYLFFNYHGHYFMTEIETICFPATYDEFCKFGSCLDELLNVATVYDKYCHQQQQQQQQQQVAVFSYEVMNKMYELSTSKRTNTIAEEPSSTDALN